MKTMTCKDLGGTCDQKLTAGSWDEIVKGMTKHVMEKHPDVAKQMEKMHNEDPKKWLSSAFAIASSPFDRPNDELPSPSPY